MKTIVIATKNKGKIKEMIKQFGNLPVQIKSLAEFGDLPDAVENGKTFTENAKIKASFYAKLIKQPCLADDSGLEVEALAKRPGIYSARFAGEHGNDVKNNAKLVSEIKKAGVTSSAACYRCAMVFCDTDGQFLQVKGSCEGVIKLQPRGENGFGYDPYFYPVGEDKTMAQLSAEEKNKISHRGEAIRKMKELLAEYLA